MIDWHTLLLFGVMDFLLCITPGPVVIAVVSQQLTRQTRGTIGMIAGINVANFIWYALVGFGLLALVASIVILHGESVDTTEPYQMVE